ncbi:hypothetical protein PMAYCL1PPCAC_25120 [Pristionchus mayeri]|uniref:Peptidase n=1 Tax=Pristionchus mayeri TaxID=1317129 RepID=A0AAN5D368_9BILA|nr:hypothetical protein PMAYCL1PPCAC_25120 [Pristionchus mayeri]
MLVYHGDTDILLPVIHSLESTRRIAARNALKDQKYDSAWRFYGDFAGIRKGYRKGNTTMDVISVRGAGHSVPTDLPGKAFQMINNFLFTEENKAIDYSEPIKKH